MGRVLVVDDNPQLLLDLRRHLEGRGHECVPAGTLERARTAAAGTPFDVVMLPAGALGPALDAIREFAGPDGTRPVVATFDDADAHLASAALAAGAYDAFIKYPGTEDRLVGRIIALLDGAVGESETASAARLVAESNAILRAQLATTSEAMLVVDPDGRVVGCNPRFVALAGLPDADATAADVRAVLRTVFAGARSGEGEHHEPSALLDAPHEVVEGCTSHLADGRIISWSSHPVRLEDGAPVGRAYGFRDVTAQRAVEHQVEFQASLLEQVPTAVIATTRDGIIRYWNPAAAALYGWSTHEVRGRDVRPLIFGTEPREEIRAVHRQLEATGRWEGEVQLRRAGGTTFPAMLVLTRWEGRVGLEPMVIGVTIDLSDRRSLEARLLQSQKMEAVGTLAGGLAHDFNNLLTGVLGSAALIRETPGLDAGTADLMDMIERAALRGRDLCRQLLGFSRSDPPAKEPVEVEGAIEEVVKIVERTFPRRVRIQVHVGDALPPILADRSQLSQALMNLMVNSRDAMAQGGRLELRVALSTGVPGDQLHHPVDDGRTYVRFDVADSGSGMGPDVMARMFEPFFTTKQTGQGTGLGLPIVFSIARSHDGQVRAWSAPEQGTTMSLFIPVVEGVEVSTASSEPFEVERYRGTETVLVVDDEAIARGVAARILRQYGYQAIEAASGPEALDLVLRDGVSVDAVLLDIVMPEMEGPEVFRRLREAGFGAPVLLCSGFSVAGLVDRMLKTGVAGFIQKPYRLVELLPPLRKVLDRATAAAPEAS